MNEIELKEIFKCSKDIKYFAENYIKICHLVKGVIPIVLNNDQLDILDQYNNSGDNIIKGMFRRQCGKTTMAAIIMLHKSLFEEDKTSVILSRNLKATDFILKIFYSMYDFLPDFMKFVKFIKRNKNYALFSNNSSIRCASNSNHMRGFGINFLYVDEYKYIRNFSEIMESIYPCVVSHRNSKILGLTS